MSKKHPTGLTAAIDKASLGLGESASISAEAMEKSFSQYPESLHLLDEMQGSAVQEFMKDVDFSVSDHHHWVGCPLNPDGNFGFIYLIFNTIDGRMYVGKKQFWSKCHRKVKGKTRRKVVTRELDWQHYTGSSEHLNADIKKYGKDKFVFFSLIQLETRGGLHYAEIECQVLLRVLTATLPDGTRLFYNRQINGCRFLPKESLSDDHRRKIALALTGKTGTRLGVKTPEETKQKLREAVGPEERKLRSERFKGKALSEEHRKKIADAMRERARSGLRVERMTPRKAARQSGEETYVGSPCKVCGGTVRRVKNGMCMNWKMHASQ